MRLPEPHFPAPVAMVRPQETALVPTVSGQLERSSSKAEAIRRGDLKISGPIPLTGEEEQDLAKRNTDSTPQRTDSTSTRNLLHKKSINAGSHNADPVETTSELQESPSGLRHKRSSTGILDLSEIQRHTSLDLLASHNSPSPFASASDSSAKMIPKKKRSGLRNVFRKIFGKRSKEEVKRDSAQKHGYHHSVSWPVSGLIYPLTTYRIREHSLLLHMQNRKRMSAQTAHLQQSSEYLACLSMSPSP